MSIVALFAEAHRHCEEQLAALQIGRAAGDWARAQTAYWRFRHTMEAHFDAEEHGVFPAFELATGVRVGPTSVLRSEHEAMRALLAHIGGALAAMDEAAFDDQLSQLSLAMSVHAQKEEHVLYAVSEQALEGMPKRLLDSVPGLLAA